MSKYIKLEDAEDKMYQLWEEDTDNKINSAYCFEDDRTIEALLVGFASVGYWDRM